MIPVRLGVELTEDGPLYRVFSHTGVLEKKDAVVCVCVSFTEKAKIVN